MSPSSSTRTLRGTTSQTSYWLFLKRPFAQRHVARFQNGLHLWGYLHVALHVLRKVARADRRLLRCGYFPHLALRHFLVELVEKCHDSSFFSCFRCKIKHKFWIIQLIANKKNKSGTGTGDDRRGLCREWTGSMQSIKKWKESRRRNFLRLSIW